MLQNMLLFPLQPSEIVLKLHSVIDRSELSSLEQLIKNGVIPSVLKPVCI